MSISKGFVNSRSAAHGGWSIDAAVEGSAGAPVFDNFGQLIGIVAGSNLPDGQPIGLEAMVPMSVIKVGSGDLKWKLGTASTKLECKGTPQIFSGPVGLLSEAVHELFDRNSKPSDLVGIIAQNYPWIILDGAVYTLNDNEIIRACRLELRSGAKIIIGKHSLKILVNFMKATQGQILSADTRTGAGSIGQPGSVAGDFTLAVLVKFDGLLDAM